MPLYEFRCEKCQKKFSFQASITEYGKKHPVCPKCKSRKVARVITSVSSYTDSKSWGLKPLGRAAQAADAAANFPHTGRPVRNFSRSVERRSSGFREGHARGSDPLCENAQI